MKEDPRPLRHLPPLLLLLLAAQMRPGALEAELRPPRPDHGPSLGHSLPPALVVFPGAVGPARLLPGTGRRSADTLSLSEAIRTALAKSPDISAARATVSEESAARWADWGSLLPELRSGADFARIEGTRITFEGEEGTAKEAPQSFSFVRKGARQSASLHWKLLDGGKRYFRIKEGGARRRSAEQRLARRERVVVSRVKRVYFEALKQQKLVEASEGRLEARQEEFALTRKRHEAGSVGRLDLLGAEMGVREARVRLLDARRRATEEVRRLQTEIGVEVERPPAVPALAPVPLPKPGQLDAEVLAERALSTDPGLKALTSSMEAASAAVGRSWTRYLPEIELSYGKLRSEVGGPESDFFKFSPRDDFDQLALTVSWNPFVGFDRRAETARARAEKRRISARRRARRLELEREVRNRVGEIRARFDRLEAQRENHDLAEERLELARLRYEADRMEYDRYQLFIDDVRDAEEAVFNERFEYLKVWAELEEMTGDLPSGSGFSSAPGLSP